MSDPNWPWPPDPFAARGSLVDDYRRRKGQAGPPRDAWEQIRLLMLREWERSLRITLKDEGVPPQVAQRVLRAVVREAMPADTDLAIREELFTVVRDTLASRPPLPMFGVPGTER